MSKKSELTLRVFIIAIILTVVLATANAFLALKLGILTSASIPAAILSIGILRFFKNSSIWENNLVQTAASAGEAVAGGIVYTIPALVIIGFWHDFSYWENFFIACISGLLGVLFSVPLRKTLVNHSGLPFPEGKAIAAILENQSNAKGFKLLILGIVLGAVIDFMQTGLHVIATNWVSWHQLGYFTLMFSMGFSIAMISAGFLVGPRMSLSILIGALIAWYMVLPYFSFIPSGHENVVNFGQQLWSQQIRYFGIGALLISGVLSLFLLIKPLLSKMVMVAQTQKKFEDAEKDIPQLILWGAVALLGLLLMVFFKQLMPIQDLPISYALGYKLIFFAVLFVLLVGFVMATVSAYFSAMVGVSASPGSSVVIASLMLAAWSVLAFLNQGILHDKALLAAEAIVIILASMVTGIAAISNDNIQDLKVGHIIGATPWKQQLMLMIGVVVSALVIPAVMQILFKVYGIAGHSLQGDVDAASSLPAPTAALLATLTDGFFQHALPWQVIFMGSLVMACIIALIYFFPVVRGLGLSFFGVAIGMYLPMETSTPIILGGGLSWLIQRREHQGFIQAGSVDKMVCLVCGLVAGSAVMDVILAFFFAWHGDTNYFSWVQNDPYHLTVYAALALIVLMALSIVKYRQSSDK
jgi:putative OPT family oligopeptide transporter